ncbi:MAG: polyprenyl synthetase family protein [Bacteroidia bacterium]|nr:polyprenyl synthetase family protein [Bacteroidia bacterium]MDW8348181.1 polyprenyl synthetase family protein [Bacteroidia bacterium]
MFASSSLMLDIQQKLQHYQNHVEKALSRLSLPKEPTQLYEPIRYTLSLKAKRMRPMLVLLALDLFQKPLELGYNAVCGIELFHNFTLIHDDIMDNAPTRRGMPTVFAKWNTNTAILSGDATLVLAYQWLTDTPSAHLKKILEIFHKTALEVCEGQMLDLEFESRNDVTIPEYIEMIRLKTSVLLGCSLYIGALLADTSIENAQKLYDFGVKLGIAFQLQDDYLDVYADSTKFGKQTGGDIIANKKTWLLLKAKEIANPEQRKEIQACLDLTHPQEKVQKMKNIYEKLNIAQLAAQEIDILYQQSMRVLDALPNHIQTSTLRAFAHFLMNRER